MVYTGCQPDIISRSGTTQDINRLWEISGAAKAWITPNIYIYMSFIIPWYFEPLVILEGFFTHEPDQKPLKQISMYVHHRHQCNNIMSVPFQKNPINAERHQCGVVHCMCRSTVLGNDNNCVTTHARWKNLSLQYLQKMDLSALGEYIPALGVTVRTNARRHATLKALGIISPWSQW